MPRKPRVEYAGAVYHVMNRGDRGGRVFRDEPDYEMFVAKTGEVCSRTGWKIHSYVLMPNHFHWLVETEEANLVAGMKWFLGAYSQGFNARHGQRGHVFQGRYKAVLVEAESGNYFETVSTYIHLNPARADLLGTADLDLGKYRWSSYPLYLAGRKNRPKWVEVGRVLGNLGLEDNAEGRRRYGDYIRERMKELRTRAGKRMYKDVWNQIRHGWCLGGQAFEEKMLERVGLVMDGKQRESYSGEATRKHDEREAENLIRRGMKTLGVSEEDVLRAKKGALIKGALAWYVHTNAMASHKWISDRLQTGCPSNLTSYISRFKNPSGGESLRLRRMLEHA